MTASLWIDWGQRIARPTRERLGWTRTAGRQDRPLARDGAQPRNGLRAPPHPSDPPPRRRRPDIYLPDDEWLHFCLDGIPAGHLRQLISDAPYDLPPPPRRSPLRRHAHLHPRRPRPPHLIATVEAERELARDLLTLLCPGRDPTAAEPNPIPTKENLPMPKPKPPATWGCTTLPTLREAAGLTRDRLALRASLAEKTLRDIEAGRVEPTPDQRARLTTVLELTKLAPPEPC